MVEKISTNTHSIYNQIWRWHFYAGLVLSPFILIIAITGALYLFQDEIDGILYKKLFNIEAQNYQSTPEYLPADILVENAVKQYPQAKKLAYIPPKNSSKSALIRLQTLDYRQMLVAVNPYSGEVIGAIDYKNRLMWQIRKLHGSLMIGKVGKIIVELCASWAVVLICSGLYLWFCSKKTANKTKKTWHFLKMIVPDFKLNKGRKLWQELHSVIGFWISIIIIFLVISGLPWSLIAGEIINKIERKTTIVATNIGWDGGGSKTLKSSIPSSPKVAQDEIDNKKIEQGWNNDHAEFLSKKHLKKQDSLSLLINRKPLSIQQIIEISKSNSNIINGFELRLPIDENGVYSIVNPSQNDPQQTAYIHFDQYSGEVLSRALWSDFSLFSKSIAIGVALHEGRYFGGVNQLVNLTACLGLIFMIFSGFAMWLKRKPQNSFGAPKVKNAQNFGVGIILLILILAIFMPIFGASLMLIFLVESIFRIFKKYRRL